MNAPAKPWAETTATEKRLAVKTLILQGIGYTRIADKLGAPNRHCIAGVVSRLRRSSELPPAPSKQQTGASGGAVVRAKARRTQSEHLHAGNIANKAESRKAEPELNLRREDAFNPLPGFTPISILDLRPRSCRWMVNGLKGHADLFCGAPKEIEHSYCSVHRALAYQPPTIRHRAGVTSAERNR